jgi:hypothetical protein
MTDQLAQQIMELIDEATAQLCPKDAFETSGAAIACAVDALDEVWKRRADCDFREGVIDCLTGRRLN